MAIHYQIYQSSVPTVGARPCLARVIAALCFVCIILLPAWAAAPSNVPDAAKKTSKNNTKKKSLAPLIPPPPPNQPSIMMSDDVSGFPFQVEYLSKEEAEQKQKDVKQQLADAKANLDDKVAQLKEKKDKAQKFGPFYEEGVVSRHELEEAQKDATDYEKMVERAKRDYAMLESQSKLLEQKLASFKKKVGQTKTTHKSSKQ